MLTTPLFPLLACASHPAPVPQAAPVPSESLELGSVLASVPTASDPVLLPDPQGRPVILELLRSPDW